jgi:hypothetical protein
VGSWDRSHLVSLIRFTLSQGSRLTLKTHGPLYGPGATFLLEGSDQKTRHIGDSQSKRPPKRTQRPPPPEAWPRYRSEYLMGWGPSRREAGSG